eukprot:5626471-Amphidinium_carterae.2
MTEFIRHSGGSQRYISLLRQLESSCAGASTDLQHDPPPQSLEVTKLLGAGSLPPLATFVEFIAHRQILALHAAYSQIIRNQPVPSPSSSLSLPTTTVHSQCDFTCTLKLLSINVRSLHDSGKVKFVFSQLAAIDTDIAFVQETRLPAHFDFPQMDGFHLATSPADTTRGGLMIAVRKSPAVSVLKEKTIGWRILILTIMIAGKQCRLVCMHAPTAESSQSEHDFFAADVGLAVADLLPGEVLLIGSDLNARLGGLDDTFACVGQQAVSTCPVRAVFRHECLRLLSAAGLIACNTVISQPSHTTWKHPSGSEHQIDFLWIPVDMIKSGSLISCKTGPWAFFDCSTTSDHRHVEALILFQSCRRGRPGKRAAPRARLAGDEHLDLYKTAIAQALPDWDKSAPPAQYLQQAMSIAADTVRTTAPARAPQRKPWISAQVWSQMFELNLWRRYYTAIKRRDHLQMQNFYQRLGSPHIVLTCMRHHGSAHCACSHIDLLESSVANLVQPMRAKLKKALRQCRSEWFTKLCSEVDNHGIAHRSRLLHQAVKQICAKRGHKGSRLLADDGSIVSDRSAVAQQWMKHWQQHFQASLVKAYSFSDREQRTCNIPDVRDVDSSDPETFTITVEEVKKVLRSAPQWKATADAAPAAALVAIANKLAEPLCALYNTCMRERTVPVAYSGARIAPVWKRKGSEFHCEAFRPVALLTLEAKILAKLCLDRLAPRLSYHCSQYGSGACPGVFYPQISVIQAAAHAKQSGLASATVFVDVIGAFDSVPLPMLWSGSCGGTVEDKSASFQQLGYSQPTAESMATFLQSHPCILEKIGVPHAVIALLRNWGSHTWLVTDAESDTAAHPHTGVLQGQNLAGLLFDLFYADLMEDVNCRLAAEGLGISLPLPSNRSLVVAEHAASIHIGGVAYRDDYALPIHAHSNAELIHLIGKVTETLAAVHREHHLSINYSKGKTECTVHLTPPDAKAYLQGLKLIGKASGLPGPAVLMPSGQKLLVAADYNHLGRSHSENGSVKKEIKTRIAKATGAFNTYHKVLTAPNIAVVARLALFRTYVVCHLVQHAPSMPRLSDVDYHRLRTCYMRLLRRTLRESSNSHRISTLSDSELCARYRAPTFLTLWDHRRLIALAKLIILDSPPLRCLLASCWTAASIWSGMFCSLARIKAQNSDMGHLPVPSSASFSCWVEYIISKHSDWRRIVKSYVAEDPRYRVHPAHHGQVLMQKYTLSCLLQPLHH